MAVKSFYLKHPKLRCSPPFFEAKEFPSSTCSSGFVREHGLWLLGGRHQTSSVIPGILLFSQD
ncbi:AB hydrolase-1 domain-containing protein [Psidium guajava]|nr:AB hydrolase-1 domain-containing protein [Psidium guajava]